MQGRARGHADGASVSDAASPIDAPFRRNLRSHRPTVPAVGPNAVSVRPNGRTLASAFAMAPLLIPAIKIPPIVEPITPSRCTTLDY